MDDRRTHPEPPGESLSGGDAHGASPEAGSLTRWDRVLHVVLLLWGASMLGIVLAGVIAFLVYFFLLQR